MTDPADRHHVVAPDHLGFGASSSTAYDSLAGQIVADPTDGAVGTPLGDGADAKAGLADRVGSLIDDPAALQDAASTYDKDMISDVSSVPRRSPPSRSPSPPPL